MNVVAGRILAAKLNKEQQVKMQTWGRTAAKKTLLKHLKARRKISLSRKKCPKGRLITFGVYFDNNKVCLGTTAADYVLEHIDARDNQE